MKADRKWQNLDSDTLFLEKDMDITCGSKNDFRYKYPILTVSVMPQTIENNHAEGLVCWVGNAGNGGVSGNSSRECYR